MHFVGTRAAAPLLALSLLALAGCASTAQPAVQHQALKAEPVQPPAALLGLQAQLVKLYRTVSPSVVQISTSADLGSGIVFNTGGDIVTNNHVADGFKSFTVTLASGRQYHGSLVSAFPADDLAVIHINATGLHPAKFATPSQVQVGEVVMAIGNPLGLQSSATEGIVSALGRTVSESPSVTIPDMVQTSAAINPGNSGGALVDLSGRVVGVPTLVALDQQIGGTAADGIGFAIPSQTVSNLAGQIAKYGHVVNSGRAFIGVDVAQASNAQGQPSGVLVIQVTRAAASQAGLVAGDIITALNGQATLSVDALTAALATLAPGQSVSLTVQEPSGGSTSLTVVLGQLPGG